MPPICAICQGTNNTTRLCGPCRADPANAGWSEGDQALHPDRIDLQRPAASWDDLTATPLAPVDPAVRAVLSLVVLHRIKVPVRPRGATRYRVEWRWRKRALNLFEVAFLAGVEKRRVRRILRRELGV